MEGYELRTPRIDTVELSQIVFPTLEKYSLGSLAHYLDIDLQNAHTAIADAMATAELFISLYQKLSSFPKETLTDLLSLSDNLLYESYLLIEEAYKQAKPYSKGKFNKVNHIIVQKPSKTKKPLKLSQDFEVNLALLDLERRERQLEFVQIIEDEFETPFPIFVEAQSGLGKTYGYLLPILARTSSQIIVTVPTKVIQDQMLLKELKQLKETFNIRSYSLKGPQNYIKLDLFAESLNQIDSNRMLNRFKMQILVWLLETETGDLDEIKQQQRFASFFDTIKHDGNISQKSPYKEIDFWVKNDFEAKKSHILVTNHAYFLTRVQDDKDFVKNKILVVDEAQRMLLALEQFARQSLDLSNIIVELSSLSQDTSHLTQKRIAELLMFELSHMIEEYYQHSTPEIPKQQLQIIEQSLSELDHVDFGDLLSLCQNFTSFWLSHKEDDGKRKTYLNGASENLLDFEAFLPPVEKLFLISATLQFDEKTILPQLLGFKQFTFSKVAKRKNEQQLLIIDKSMPSIQSVSEDCYVSEIGKRLLALVKLEKPILVLFHSQKMLIQTSDYLNQLNVPHLAQDRNGNASNVKRRFERGDAQILLGMGAFWEGVDFIQNDRMIEVITRLPFDNPEDPFYQKVLRHMSQSNQNTFYTYSLPMMFLKLKQAIGRTIRRENQKSVVLILDNRIETKSYSSIILHLLKNEYVTYSQKVKDYLATISDFLL